MSANSTDTDQIALEGRTCNRDVHVTGGIFMKRTIMFYASIGAVKRFFFETFQ